MDNQGQKITISLTTEEIKKAFETPENFEQERNCSLCRLMWLNKEYKEPNKKEDENNDT